MNTQTPTQKRNKTLMYKGEKARQKKREAIAQALADGKTYKTIQAELHTSTATIASVKRMLEEEQC